MKVVGFLTASVAFLSVFAAILVSFPWNFGCGFESETEFQIISKRVITPSGVHPASLHIKDGKIQKVIPLTKTQDLEALNHLKTFDYGNWVIGPGLVDCNVHLSEPGFDWREGVKSGTRAARAGGITTLIDMPLHNSPPTDSCQRLKMKTLLFKEDASVNMGAWGGLTDQNANDTEVLQCMVEEAGAFGFVCNAEMSSSTLDVISRRGLEAAISNLKELGVALVLEGGTVEGKEMVENVLSILKEKKNQKAKEGFRVHFQKVTHSDILQKIKLAKEKEIPVSVEISPHYLFFGNKNATGNALLNVQPPIGNAVNLKTLENAVRNKEIDLIASDHLPSTPREKFHSSQASLGITGLQYLLPVTWTVLSESSASQKDLVLVHQLLSTHPAKLLRLESSKGTIAEGFDADLVVWDPEGKADTSVKGSKMRFPEISPYLDVPLNGSVKATWLHGNLVFDPNLGLSRGTCRKVYGLGSWAKTKVLGFLPISFSE